MATLRAIILMIVFGFLYCFFFVNVLYVAKEEKKQSKERLRTLKQMRNRRWNLCCVSRPLAFNPGRIDALCSLISDCVAPRPNPRRGRSLSARGSATSSVQLALDLIKAAVFLPLGDVREPRSHAGGGER